MFFKKRKGEIVIIIFSGVLICLWAYICASIAYRAPPNLRRLSLKMLGKEANVLQQALIRLGIEANVMKYQSVRYATIVTFCVTSIIYIIVSDAKSHSILMSLMLIFLSWLLSGSQGLYLAGTIRKKMTQHEFKRDGELIAFARLYELQKRTKRIELAAFCTKVTDHLPILRNELLNFAQRITTDGKSEAFTWFENRFSKNHPFVHKLLYTIRSNEGGGDEDGFSSFLEKVSQDHFARNKKAKAPLFNILSALPTILVIMNIFMILMQYVSITSGSLSIL